MFSACTSEGRLNVLVGATSAECPMDLGDGLTITNIDTEGNNVVYTCVVDEMKSEISVADWDNSFVRSMMKEYIINDFISNPDPDMKELIQLVKEANYNFVFRYIGSHTNNKIEIVVYPYEL